MKFNDLIRINEDFHGEIPSWFFDNIPVMHVSYGIYENAFVSKGSIKGWPRNVESVVCDSQFNEIENSIFKRAYRISVPPEDAISQKLDSKILKGKYIYLGWIIAHYGHFITESISRFWWLVKEKNLQDMKFLIHANFGTVNDFPIHVKSLFTFLNIDLANVYLVKDSYTVDQLVVPSQAVCLDYSIAEEQKLVWDTVRNSIVFNRNTEIQLKFRKIFLSRKHQDYVDKSRQYNDEAVEDVFKKYGFEVIYPELLSLEEQIEVYSSSNFLAGPVGSAMHNSIFMPASSQVLILGANSFIFKTDALICNVKSHRLNYFLTDVGTSKIQRIPFQIDCRRLQDYLEKVIKGQRSSCGV